MLAYDILDGDNPAKRESGITQTEIEEESDIENEKLSGLAWGRECPNREDENVQLLKLFGRKISQHVVEMKFWIVTTALAITNKHVVAFET